MDDKKKKSREVQPIELRIAGQQRQTNPTNMKMHAKVTAMKIAQTHIEIQNLTVDEKGACKSADKFLAWLKK